MLNEKIKDLRNKYYDAIINLQDESDIRNSLPTPDYESFFEIMDGLVDQLKELIINLKEEKNQPSDKETIEYIEEEIKLTELKIKICIELIKKAKETLEVEKESLVPQKKNIIFAETNNGKNYIEKDLKQIPEEYYSDVLDSIEKLEDGYEENNPEKAKSLQNNKKLSKIHEIKPFKVRIFYKKLDKDTILVFQVKMKKSNNDQLDREAVIKRNKKIKVQFEELKDLLKDENIKKSIIEKNQQEKEKIKKILKTKRRG